MDPVKPRRRNLHLTDRKAALFLEHLAQTGSVTLAAETADVGRTALYQRRVRLKRFARRWAEATELARERLEDDAMRRVLQGVERPVWRNGEQVGTVRQFDNRLLQFMLSRHHPAASLSPEAAAARLNLAAALQAADRRVAAWRARQATVPATQSTKTAAAPTAKPAPARPPHARKRSPK